MTLQTHSKSYYVNESRTLFVGAAAGLAQGDASSAGAVSIAANTGPSQGGLSLTADGGFVYTPNPGFVGVDSFTFLVSDGATTVVETAQVAVGASILRLADDSYALGVGQTLTHDAGSGMLGNDYANLGSPTVIAVSPPSHGTLSAAPDGSFAYVAGSAAASDIFEYTATDGAVTATATVTINLVAPLLSINADRYGVAAGGQLAVAAANGLLANDFASTGALTASLAAGPAHGAVAINPDGGFVYTPDAGFSGLDTFSYAADAGAGFAAFAAVTVNVVAGGLVATGASYVETTPTLAVSAAQGLLAHAFSSFGGLSLISTGAAAHGTFAATADGGFTYASDPGFFGDDAVSYTVGDASGHTATATATLAVADRAPTTGKLAYVVHGASVSVGAAAGLLRATYGYAGQETVRSYAAAHGALVVNPDGSFIYTPNPGFVGLEGVSFVAADSFGVAVTQTATLDVVGQPPFAIDDHYSVTSGRSLDVGADGGLIANDADPDGDSLAVTATDAPAHGQLAVNADGSFSYTPDSGFVGSDSFGYTVTDSTGVTASATAQVDVVAFAIVCFARGARLATAQGEVEVERLRVGDLMRTASGALRPIVWIGHRKLDCRRHPRPREGWPILISAGAFGPGLPRRDLSVSPRHALAIGNDALVPAAALVNGATIKQVEVETVEYWHVELESHDLLLAEGLAAESYLETGSRGFFVESKVVGLGLAPDGPRPEFCQSLHESGPVLAAARARLAARAEALGWRRTAAGYAGLHLLADGLRIEPAVEGGVARFVLPAGARELWLAAETSRPCDLGDSADGRALGVAVCGVAVVDGSGGAREIALDDERLGAGWFEREAAGHRWTGARARLDGSLLAPNGSVLRLALGPPLARWVGPAEPPHAAVG